MSDLPRPLPGGAPADPDPMIGRTLAERYRIDGLLARGGMARVYRARDERLERDVAVKILSPPFADDAEFSDRFLAEARAAASLTHPSLVHVYDSGSDGSAHIIVMELLDRHRSLRQELDARGRLPADEVVRIGRELLAGLGVVHERGLVHCDVKPANIMLGPGPAKLIDFGIARSPHAPFKGDTSIGSLHFMSPEQLHGESLTPASDMFSLAVVLYEALTGRVPFPGDTPERLSAAQASAGVRPPSTVLAGIPGRLDEAILQALRVDPEQRFHKADAMSRALAAAGEEVTTSRDHDTTAVRRVVVARPPVTQGPPRGGYVPPPAPPVHRSAYRPAPPPPPRRRVPWGLLGTLAMLGAAALVVVLIVLPLLEIGQGFGPASPTPAPSIGGPTPNAGVVVVPNTIGMSAADATRVASDAGLNWTVYCNHDESLPEGIIDQEPPARTEVRVGSAFSMYSARISDCED
ncbi:MAG: serine/threonine-protein kinase [Chloroflexi bacterium]|nr:serine/threonine-protein kinase [Chloroflexota bacterium]